MDRRLLIVGSTSFVVGSSIVRFAHASETHIDVKLVSELPPLPDDLSAHGASPPAPYTATELVGTAPPKKEEIDAAYDLLIQAPYKTTPIAVAQYFLAVGAGAYGSAYKAYAREWPIRANPLIYHFFSSTKTTPEGDETAWCAAFVNWCLLRSRAENPDEIGAAPGFFSRTGKPFPIENIRDHSTNSASSGSFRCWDEAPNPKLGNIAVFKNAGTDSLTAKCLGQGHVAFYIGRPTPNTVRVLGGNQRDPGSGGAITVADMPAGPGSRYMKCVEPK